MTLPPIDHAYLLRFLTGLLNTPSPTGFAHEAVEFVIREMGSFSEVSLQRSRKGALLAELPGERKDAPRMITAHIDTLGALVKEIKPNGRLRLSKIGGYAWNTVETEGLTIFTNAGQRVRGSLLFEKASAHIFQGKVNETQRADENMEVRLDARTTGIGETRALGISVGDFVAFDPRVEVVNGFIRSRHLDDKAGAACLAAAVKALHDAGLKPHQKATLLFTNYEEAGHGASGVPEDIAEFLVVDMAAVGDGQNSDEFHASLCVKDSGGPYHHELSQRLRHLAEGHGIDYRVDIYPFYSSDGTALWKAGRDVAVALIGPGVDASHNYERTHLDSLVDTTRWILAYLLSA